MNRKSWPTFFENSRAPLDLTIRNNNCSDDDKRLVTRYSPICFQKGPSSVATVLHSGKYVHICIVVYSSYLATNNEAKQHHQTTKGAMTRTHGLSDINLDTRRVEFTNWQWRKMTLAHKESIQREHKWRIQNISEK